MNQLTQDPLATEVPETTVELNDSDDVSAATDPRHQRRINLMQALFSYSFSGNLEHIDPEQATELEVLLKDVPAIDDILTSAAPERPLADVNKVDLAILRLIMFESRHKKTPKKVLLDESVELAKEFGTESSPSFVNGVLGKLLGTETTM